MIIDYSDATVPSSNNASKASLDSSGFLAQGLGSWFCKLTLFNTVISGQNLLAFSSAHNQTGPNAVAGTDDLTEAHTGNAVQTSESLGLVLVVCATKF